MTDRELLELAAKAVGIAVEWREWTTSRIAEFGCIKYTKHEGFRLAGQSWNPLTDDGDALRLAAACGIAVVPYPIYEWPKHSVVAARKSLDESRTEVVVHYGTDPYAATRRAIVRAAAEIGKGL